MKKRTPLVMISLLGALLLSGCDPNNTDTPNPPDENEVTNSFLVSFYVDGNLYKTAKVKENEVVGNIIDAPKKANYEFKGWKTENGETFDLLTIKVIKSIRVNAYFELIKKDESNDNVDIQGLNVLDTKDATKTYSLVIGWYGKSSTSGCNEENMKHFYSNVIKFLRAKKVSESDIRKISFRKYGDDTTNVATLGTLVNADLDVDLMLGCGKNITTTGRIATIDRIDNVTIGTATSRVIGKLSEKKIANALFEHLKTENGLKMLLDDYFFDEKDVNETPVAPDIPSPDEAKLNVLDVKDPTKTYSFVIGWYGKSSTSGCNEENMIHFYSNVINFLKAKKISDEEIKKISFRKYGDNDTKVAALGELVNKDADVDLLLGVGGNIDTTGAVATIEKIENLTIGEKTGRVAARLTNKEMVIALCDFLKTENGAKMFNSDYTFNESDLKGETSVEPTEPTKPIEIDETSLNVTDIKDASKAYSLVIGWYGKSAASGCNESTMKHFYANAMRYLSVNGAKK